MNIAVHDHITDKVCPLIWLLAVVLHFVLSACDSIVPRCGIYHQGLQKSGYYASHTKEETQLDELLHPVGNIWPPGLPFFNHLILRSTPLSLS